MMTRADLVAGLRDAGFPTLDLCGCGDGLPDVSVLVGGSRRLFMVLDDRTAPDTFTVRSVEQAVELATVFEAALEREAA